MRLPIASGRLLQRRLRIAVVASLLALALVYYVVNGSLDWQSRVTSITHPNSGLESDSTSPDTIQAEKSLPLAQVTHVADTTLLQPTHVSHETTLENNGNDTEQESQLGESLPSETAAQCLPFEQWQHTKPTPLSEGKRRFPYMRPPPACRTFNLPSMEKLIEDTRDVVKDPDLFRLFENSYPNTLDTMIKWRGYANATDPTTGEQFMTDEELTYVITGDIDAMWLRDSASQVYSYLPLLEASGDRDSLASLWRGLINIHARYIIISPYCHSFQPPPESGVPPTHNGAYSQNHPNPPYDRKLVFDCKWELDSLASFLQISTAYYQRTNDLAFFQKYRWIPAVAAVVKAAGAMRLGTYSKEGKVEQSAWTFTGWTNRGSETLTNDGLGNPTKENGMVRTAFRPSDDACIYQLLVPANMMFAKYLEEASLIMAKLDGTQAENLTTEMRDLALGIRRGIDRDAVVHHRDFGDIWAYEIDGYGGTNLMDDANIPSLLATPLFNYTTSSFPLPLPVTVDEPSRNLAQIYSNTRRFVLSSANPYFMRGPAISAVGGPHLGPGKSWPMAAIVTALTAYTSISGIKDSDVTTEVAEQMRMILDSTGGMGIMHESVNAWNELDWTRAWFGWANGLFGELIIKIADVERKQGGVKGEDKAMSLLGRSWQ